MNRTVSLSLALGLAVAALAGCVGAPDGQNPDDNQVAQAPLINKGLLLQTPVDTRTTVAQPTTDLKVVAATAELTTAAPAATSPRLPPRIEGCERYDVYTAALAELTIACTGTLGPQSFSIDGPLRRKFDKCDARGSRRVSLQDIDDILALQHPGVAKDLAALPDWKEAPTFEKCFAGQWKLFLDLNVPTCPNWYEIGTIHKATEESVKEFAASLPGDNIKPGAEIKPPSDPVALPKQNFVYVVKLPDGATEARCGTPEACAKVCTSGLPGFFVESRELAKDEPQYQGLAYQGKTVIGDPLWWLDPTYYAPSPSPYMTADFYHPMSFYRNLPGAIFAHRARELEACSYWNGVYHMIGVLKRYCIPGADPASDSSACPSTICSVAEVVDTGGTL
jgi:hypothetical protein